MQSPPITTLETVLSYRPLAAYLLSFLPSMGEVARLALVSRWFYAYFKNALPRADEPRNIFAHIFAQSIYRGVDFSPVVSLRDAALANETDRQFLLRNYLVVVEPTIGLDLEGLLSRFASEWGDAFELFLSFTEQHLFALTGHNLELTGASLFRLRCEFCRRPDRLRLLKLGVSRLELIHENRRLMLKEAEENFAIERQIAQVSRSVDRLHFTDRSLNIQSSQLLDPSTVVLQVKVAEQPNPFSVPITYDPTRRIYTSRSVVRSGLRHWSGAINVT